MSDQAYELLALLMRYVFVLIGLLIVWRAFRWMRRDASAYQKEIRSLPDAGLVGEIVNLTTGKAQPLPREGSIGSSRECDIRVKGSNVLRNHARFEFEEGKGLKIIPNRRGLTVLAGAAMKGPGYALHGTQLMIGENLLRVRLFAGLNVPLPAAYPEPDAILDPIEEEAPWAGLMTDAYSILPETQAADAYPIPGDEYPPQDYDGNYTPDGQMTWQYAYSMDELHQAMAAQQEQEQANPAVRRRRRRARND